MDPEDDTPENNNTGHSAANFRGLELHPSVMDKKLMAQYWHDGANPPLPTNSNNVQPLSTPDVNIASAEPGNFEQSVEAMSARFSNVQLRKKRGTSVRFILPVNIREECPRPTSALSFYRDERRRSMKNKCGQKNSVPESNTSSSDRPNPIYPPSYHGRDRASRLFRKDLDQVTQFLGNAAITSKPDPPVANGSAMQLLQQYPYLKHRIPIDEASEPKSPMFPIPMPWEFGIGKCPAELNHNDL